MRYITQDFYAGAILRAFGIPLTNVIKQNGNFCVFHFDATADECEEILKKHWDRTLVLPSRNLIDSIVELKNRIHGF